jgi:hypothetical protein
MSMSRINNSQAAHSQSCWPLMVEPTIIRPAVLLTIHHPSNRIRASAMI